PGAGAGATRPGDGPGARSGRPHRVLAPARGAPHEGVSADRARHPESVGRLARRSLPLRDPRAHRGQGRRAPRLAREAQARVSRTVEETPMSLHERIGVDLGGRRPIEDGLAWAAANGVHYVDLCPEGAPDHPNAPATWTAARTAALRATCERHRIHLGLHSASAVNVAETSPLLADAAEQYLKTYIDVAVRLGAEWIVVHGGYHFTGDYAQRRGAAPRRPPRPPPPGAGAGARPRPAKL